MEIERFRSTEFLNRARIRASGVVRSTDGDPALIFFLEVHGRGWLRKTWTGRAKVRVGDRHFDLALEGNAATVSVDGRRIGRIEEDGAIVDRAGEKIGTVGRPVGTPYSVTFHVGPFSKTWHKDTRDPYFEVKLAGARVADIALCRFPTSTALGPRSVSSVLLEGKPNARARRWILAVAIHELCVRGVLESVRMSRDAGEATFALFPRR